MRTKLLDHSHFLLSQKRQLRQMRKYIGVAIATEVFDGVR
jgi:hypothetical protein